MRRIPDAPAARRPADQALRLRSAVLSAALRSETRELLARRRAAQHFRLEDGRFKGSGSDSFRFWHEDRRFKGSGSDSLVQQALLAANGKRTGGHTKEDPAPGLLGHQRKGLWDVLWSPSSTALLAAEQGLRRDQLVSAVPGLQALTRKRRLPETLSAAYGCDGAACITPRTFVLPAQLSEWRACMAANASPGQLWMLKTAQHLGKGLQLVRQADALAAVAVRQAAVMAHKATAQPADTGGRRPKRHDPDAPRPFVVAQEYVANPLLLGGRKWGARLWLAVVWGPEPMRAYLHGNGLVLLATESYDPTALADVAASPGGSAAWLISRERAGVLSDGAEEESEEQGEEAGTPSQGPSAGASSGNPGADMLQAGPSPPRCHVTNYAQNVNGEVWSLQQLEQHLGRDKYKLLYRRLLRSTALTIAAALPAVRAETARLGQRHAPKARLPHGGGGGGSGATLHGGYVELLGLDFLVDEQLRPWLLEVNATPSLAVEHSDPAVERLIRQQKEGMVADLVGLMALRRRYGRRAEQGPHDEAHALRQALQARYPQAFYDTSLLEGLEAVEAELRGAGAFLPLMPLFPPPAAPGCLGCGDGPSAPGGYLLDAEQPPAAHGVTYSEADRLVRAWCRDRAGG